MCVCLGESETEIEPSEMNKTTRWEAAKSWLELKRDGSICDVGGGGGGGGCNISKYGMNRSLATTLCNPVPQAQWTYPGKQASLLLPSRGAHRDRTARISREESLLPGSNLDYFQSARCRRRSPIPRRFLYSSVRPQLCSTRVPGLCRGRILAVRACGVVCC